MSLAQKDIDQFKKILEKELGQEMDKRFDPLLDELKAARKDIKEIRSIIFKLQSGITDDINN